MMAAVKGKSKGGIFSRDKETLPFFSIHPKTRIGTALRIAFVVFFAISIIITILGNNGLVFYKYWDLYYLNYIVPISIILLLMLLALGKRIPNSILSVGIPVMIIFLLYAVIRTISVMMAYTCELTYSPEIRISCKTENVDANIALMRQCRVAGEDDPDGIYPDSTEDKNGEGLILVQREKRLITAHWSDGISGTVEGELNVPFDESALPALQSVFVPAIEWTDDNTARIYIDGDTENEYGEIKITFTGIDENAAFVPSTLMHTEELFESPSGFTAVLYSQDYKYTSIYETTVESFKRVYSAYPISARVFLKTNVRTEGELTVYPYHTISASDLLYEETAPDVIKISLKEDFTGGSGSVTVYLKETKSEAADDNAALPSEGSED